MFVVILNKSKGKTFRKTKRIISIVLPKVDLRMNMGEIPLRVLKELIMELKQHARRATNIKIFVKTKSGFSGCTLIEIGKKEKFLENFSKSNKHFII